MPKTMQMIFKELQISPQLESEQQLPVLKTWCQQQISKDVNFEGTDAYASYIEFATKYYDVFLSNLPTSVNELNKPISKLANMNAIQYAAHNGYDVYLNSLSGVSPDVYNQGNAAGMTPLHLAAVKGHFSTVIELLLQGANPNTHNRQVQLPNHTALSVPVLYGPNLIKNKKSIFERLQSCTDIKLIKKQDSDGNNILHMMSRADIGSDVFSALFKKYFDKTNYDLAFIQNNHAQYPIHIALLNNKEQMAQLMLDVQGVANLTDDNARDALSYAVMTHASKDILLKCINNASDINHRDRNGCTALMLAVHNNNRIAEELLIEHHADTHGIRSSMPS